MTDNEIIKAFNDAPVFDGVNIYLLSDKENKVNVIPLKRVTDLINRQKTEIEVLRNCVEQIPLIRKDGKSPLSLLTAEIKSEAYKEFAERLKEKLSSWRYDLSFFADREEIKRQVDNLLKEMVGEDK